MSPNGAPAERESRFSFRRSGRGRRSGRLYCRLVLLKPAASAGGFSPRRRPVLPSSGRACCAWARAACGCEGDSGDEQSECCRYARADRRVAPAEAVGCCPDCECADAVVRVQRAPADFQRAEPSGGGCGCRGGWYREPTQVVLLVERDAACVQRVLPLRGRICVRSARCPQRDERDDDCTRRATKISGLGQCWPPARLLVRRSAARAGASTGAVNTP